MKTLAILGPLVVVAVMVVLVASGSVSAVTSATIFTYAVAGTSVMFVAVYSWLAPWWRSEEGRNIATFVGVIAALSTYISSVLWLGSEYVARDWFRLITWAAVWLVIVRLFVLMVRSQIPASSQTETENEKQKEEEKRR